MNVDEQEREFTRINGDPAWLGGIHFAPKKVQRLQELNALLAFQPWKVRRCCFILALLIY